MKKNDESLTLASAILNAGWNDVFFTEIKIEKELKNAFSQKSNVPEYRKHHFIQNPVPSVPFLTDSSYAGEWNDIGIWGNGTYLFPHRVEYEGELQDGTFHGNGTLTYPMGQIVLGKWVKGRLVSFKFKFTDGLDYNEPWKYCRKPDRRFLTSALEGLQPAGRSLLTNEQPTRKIPKGCYDTGDGFYNPATKCVTSAYKPTKILRIPTLDEQRWIIENCRKEWDEPTKFRPDLYEHWVNGKKEEMQLVIDDELSDSLLSSPYSSISTFFILEPDDDKSLPIPNDSLL